jgi:hypothetical protein
MPKYNATVSLRGSTHFRTAIPLAFIFLFVFFLVKIILLSSSFGASISIVSPQAGGFTRNYHKALIAERFTKKEAFLLIKASSVPSMCGK